MADDDKKKRDVVDSRNQADSMVYQTEKQLSELGDKVPKDVKEKVEGKLNELKLALQSEDVDAIKAAQEALQQEVVSLGQAIYSNPQGGDAGQPGPGDQGAEQDNNKGDDDNVVDAEFKETD